MARERPHRRDCAITAEALTPAALYRLMTWFSPGYPIGAFSYSSGIEWTVEAGDISDATTLRSWLTVMLAEGGGYCDAVFFAHAYRAAAEMDERALRAASELAIAFAPSKERHLETTRRAVRFSTSPAPHGRAPHSIVSTRLPTGLLRFPSRSPPPAQVRALRSRQRFGCYLHALAANLVSAGVRLIPLGQSDGQRVLAALEPVVTATAARALTTPLDEVASTAIRADLASMHHETQYTRLFRS